MIGGEEREGLERKSRAWKDKKEGGSETGGRRVAKIARAASSARTRHWKLLKYQK